MFIKGFLALRKGLLRLFSINKITFENQSLVVQYRNTLTGREEFQRISYQDIQKITYEATDRTDMMGAKWVKFVKIKFRDGRFADLFKNSPLDEDSVTIADYINRQLQIDTPSNNFL